MEKETICVRHCAFQECEADAGARSEYCKPHRKLMWQRNLPVCTLEGCENKQFSKTSGVCRGHRSVQLRDSGEAKIGGKWKNRDGYIMVYYPGYRFSTKASDNIFEHVVVMCDYLGRALLPDENVHHRNGDRTDNRIENLELWSSSQPPGQSVEDKLNWAREVIARYGTPEEKAAILLSER